MGGVSLVDTLLTLFIWILPIWIIAKSDKTQGGEKVAWILAVIFVSWFAWVFYFLLAPLKSER
ncbi:PLDc N-terminal domain-containing protein [Alteromonas sp. H39]|uniref:PLDc N-terminal domain-containing protein n=1 Tax=Alteromonas sp. H39 TaxID=3389876 RepID=UPI0039E007E0